MARFKVKLLLERIRMPVPKIELEGGCIIRDSTTLDLKVFQQWLPRHEYQILMEHEHQWVKVLEREYDISLQNLKEFQDKKDDLCRVVTVLRIIKPGTLGYRVVVWEPLDAIKREVPWVQCFFSPDQMAWGEGEYCLEEHDVEVIQQFWHQNRSKLKNLSELGPMKIAISRFEMSYFKRNPIDKFLDLMISMEALYLKGVRPQEFRNKLPQRAAKLLEGDKEKRKQLRDRIRQFYDLRCKVVHGGSLKLEAGDSSGSQLVLELKDYVRRSIRSLLSICEDSRSIEKKLAELDDEAIA